MGKDHKSALLVLTDRTTLITMIEKLQGKTSTEVTQKSSKDFQILAQVTSNQLPLTTEKSLLGIIK